MFWSKKLQKGMKKYSFEKTILIVVSILTIIRYVFSLVSFLREDMDFAIFFLYNIALVLSVLTLFFINKIKNVHCINVFWTLIFVIIASSIWLITNGLRGVRENGLIGCLVLVAMLNSGKSLKILMWSVVMIQFVLLMVMEYFQEFLPNINFDIGNNSQFQTLTIYITSALLFFSYQYMKQKERQIYKKRNLHLVMSEMQDDNLNLEKQEVELRKINDKLEEGIRLRSNKLRENNSSLSSYLNVSTSEIAPTVNDLVNYIEDTDFGIGVNEMLKNSGERLNKAFIEIEKANQKRNDS